jgi:hypothetical protein
VTKKVDPDAIERLEAAVGSLEKEATRVIALLTEARERLGSVDIGEFARSATHRTDSRGRSISSPGSRTTPRSPLMGLRQALERLVEELDRTGR